MPSNKTLFMDGPIADKWNEGVNERGMIWVVGFSAIIYVHTIFVLEAVVSSPRQIGKTSII